MKNLFNNEAGVSPIVATLVLVVVAIAGAAAVGAIMGAFSGDVSDDANVGDTSGAASTEILIAGSTTVQPVSEVIAKNYMADNQGVKVTVQAGGSSAGIASAGLGIVDIGSASKFLKDSDLEKFPELETYTIGGSAVVVIGNTAFTPDTMSKGDLTNLYDGNDSTVVVDVTLPADTVVYHRSEGSGTEETFSGFVGLGGDDVDDAKAEAAMGTSVATAIGNQGVRDAVKGSSDPAIGFVDYGFAKDVDGIKILMITVDGTTYTATSSTVKAAVKDRLADSGSSDDYVYDLCRPLNYIVNGEPSAVVNDYLTYAMSPGSIEAFEEAGYYSIVELQ